MAGFERVGINLNYRCNVALGVVAAFFFVVVLRLWYLQVLKGDYFRDKSENNRLRTVFVPPPRGMIFDRLGKVVVKNRPAFNVELVAEDSPDPKASLRDLASVLGQEPNTFLDRLANQPKRRRFEPKLILKDVSREVVAKVAAKSYALPGVVVNVSPAREYLYQNFAAHVLGYIREINSDQLNDPRFTNQSYQYHQGDIVGQYGIEARWEPELQGQRGVQNVIVNATGVRTGEASFVPEIAGRSIRLTIDYDVQAAADAAMADKKGAIVALNPKSGEILAMSSAPAFDPNLFAGEMTAEQWSEMVMGKERRLNNRAVQGAYPPGSTFKIFMAVAGLAEGIITPETKISCPGYYYVGGRRFKCHKKEGHGSVDLEQAIIKSCDVYFYTVGQRLGIDRIHDYAAKFGLGVPTGLDLVTENSGLIPSTEWKREHFRRQPAMQKWFPGETPSVSIGQGAVTVTPLQLARGLAALVNGGFVMRPRLVLGDEDQAENLMDQNSDSDIQKRVDVDPKIMAIVRHALEGVVNDPGGTAIRAKLGPEFDARVAGKTGTAQAVGADSGLHGKDFADHAWFSAYAPIEDPEIVVVALVENGGHGGVIAAPLVKSVMETFFKKQCQVAGAKCHYKPLPAPETEKKEAKKAA